MLFVDPLDGIGPWEAPSSCSSTVTPDCVGTNNVRVVEVGDRLFVPENTMGVWLLVHASIFVAGSWGTLRSLGKSVVREDVGTSEFVYKVPGFVSSLLGGLVRPSIRKSLLGVSLDEGVISEPMNEIATRVGTNCVGPPDNCKEFIGDRLGLSDDELTPSRMACATGISAGTNDFLLLSG